MTLEAPLPSAGSGQQDWRFSRGQQHWRPFHGQGLNPQAWFNLFRGVSQGLQVVYQTAIANVDSMFDLRKEVLALHVRAQHLQAHLRANTEAVRELTKTVKRLATNGSLEPQNVGEHFSQFQTRLVELVFRAATSPFNAVYNLIVKKEIVSAGIDAATAVVSYGGATKVLKNFGVPYVDDVCDYVAGSIFGIGRAAAAEGARLAAESGKTVFVGAKDAATDWVKDSINSASQSAQEATSNFVNGIPFIGFFLNQAQNHPRSQTPGDRAAFGLGGGAKSFSSQHQTNMPSQGSDLFSLAMLAASVGLLYFAISKLPTYWNTSQKERQLPTKEKVK